MRGGSEPCGAVLMIGGGVQQVEAVRVARAAGWRVIVSDRSADAPALAEADEAWVVDGTDAVELARRAVDARERGLAAVFTLTELVETVAAVAAAAGLRGVPPEPAGACQDKALAKERWLAAGVPTPRGGAARDVERARALFAGLGERAFVKPARAFGGRGGSRATSFAELEGAFARAAEVASPVVVEELCEGTHHDVNGVLDDAGRFRSLGTCDRWFHPEHGYELEALAPTELDERTERAVVAAAEQALRALGVAVGPAKADLVLTPDGPRVLEVAPRLHGPKGTLHLIPLATGTQPLATVLEVLATGALPAAPDATPRRFAAFRALEAPPGARGEASGLDEARALPGVERVALLAPLGATLAPPRDATGVPGHAFATGATPAEARQRAAAAARKIRFG